MEGKDSTYFRNLEDIQAHEGIAPEVMQFSRQLSWLRDPMLFLDTGEVLLPARFHYDVLTSRVIMRLIGDQKILPLGSVAEFRYVHQLLEEAPFGQYEAPFYFEGGNLLCTLNQKDEQVYLSGSYNLLYSLLNSAFTFDSLEKLLLNHVKELEKNSPLFSDARIELIRERLARAWLFSTFPSMRAQRWLSKLCITAIEYIKEMMEIKLEKPIVFLGDVFEPQPAFHLDMFLCPAPGGVIFMQSHELCVKLLKELLKVPTLPLDHRKRLKAYLRCAEEDATDVDPMLRKVSSQLTAAGFKVIPMAGVFNFYHKTDGIHRKIVAAHFLNNLMGIGTRGIFCITNGSSHPVDEHLRTAAYACLKKHGIDTVYFTGRPSEGPTSALGQLEYLRADQNFVYSGGVHCLSQHTNALHSPFQIGSKTKQMMPDPTETSSVSLRDFFARMLKLAGIDPYSL